MRNLGSMSPPQMPLGNTVEWKCRRGREAIGMAQWLEHWCVELKVQSLRLGPVSIFIQQNSEIQLAEIPRLK